MQTELEVHFRNCEQNTALDELIRQEASRLNKAYNRIVSFKAAIEKPQKTNDPSGLYRVKLDITLPPRHKIIVKKEANNSGSLSNISALIRSAFKIAFRRLDVINEKRYPRRAQSDASTYLLALALAVFLGAGICGRTAYAYQPPESISPAPLDTDTIYYERTPLNKFTRGFVNILTCWFEIPAEIFKVSKQKDTFQGYTLGLVEGIATTLLRAGTGAADLVLSPIPSYDRPILEPEYAFTDLSNRYKEYVEESYY